MLEKYEARKAFDSCEVRALTSIARGMKCRMICAKYTEGFEIRRNQIDVNNERSILAIALGCVACPYRNMELPTGESAIKAIQMLGSPGTVVQLHIVRPDEERPEPSSSDS